MPAPVPNPAQNPAPMAIEARVTPAALTDVPLTEDPVQFAVLEVMPVVVDFQQATLQQGPAVGLVLQVVIPPELLRAPQGRLLNAQGQPTLPPDLLAALGTLRARLVVPRHLLGPLGLERVNAGRLSLVGAVATGEDDG